MRARLLLPLLLAAAAPAPAAQNVRGTLIDAGGNGAQYAVFSLIGPQNRLQNGSCPGGRSLGELPTGETTCETTFNTGGATEWQSGGVLGRGQSESAMSRHPVRRRHDDHHRAGCVDHDHHPPP